MCPWIAARVVRSAPRIFSIFFWGNMRLFLLSSLWALARSAPQSAVLSNDYLNLTIVADATGTCISELRFNLSLASAQGWTPNLLTGGLASCSQHPWAPPSGTVLEVQGVGVLFSTGGILRANSTAVTISGVSLGAVAAEDWVISLSGATVAWSVSRTFAAGGVALHFFCQSAREGGGGGGRAGTA